MDKTALAAHFAKHQYVRLDQYIYLPSPATMDDMTRLTCCGTSNAQKIKELYAAIETLQAYQLLLYDRVQEIVTAPWHQEVHLKRERNYVTGKVTYRLSLLKVYEVEGIGSETIEETTFPGKERHKAIAAFQAAQKKRPGIKTEMAISKFAWE